MQKQKVPSCDELKTKILEDEYQLGGYIDSL